MTFCRMERKRQEAQVTEMRMHPGPGSSFAKAAKVKRSAAQG